MVRMVVEFILAAAFVVLAVLMWMMPQWIETVFNVDPDQGSGALEWLIVVVFGVLALVASGLGTRDAVVLSRRAA